MRTIYIKYIEISLLRSFFQSKKQVERSGRTVKTIKRLIRRAYREILCISKPLIKLGGTTKEPIVLKNRKIGSIYVLYKKEEIKMQSKIDEIKKLSEEKISKIKNSQDLQELKVQFLGKKSELSNLLKGLGALTAEERPKVGALVNEARKEIEEKLSIAEEQIKSKMLEEKIEKETIDITLPATKIQRGSKHPVNRVIEEIEDFFVSMGYDVISGPELETDEFCFERLNLPKGHPARDMQDSFYITNEYLLRTQTSAVQARTMLANTEIALSSLLPRFFAARIPSTIPSTTARIKAGITIERVMPRRWNRIPEISA